MKINYEYIDEMMGELESEEDYKIVQEHLNKKIDLRIENGRVFSEAGIWIATLI